MDEGVKALVEFFNKRGLTTHMSCEGHYPEKPSMSMFWISFDKSVSIDDLLSFMEEHKDEYGVFACNGRFAEHIGMGRVPFFELCYFAANKEVAKMDLEKFKRLEECSNN